jgi:predicted Rossmann fold flavoprotein
MNKKTTENRYDIIIIGGGASGLMASVAAGNKTGLKVAIAEKQARTGRKLLATGNGRCNLSNRDAAPSSYNEGSYDFVRAVFASFDAAAALNFFESIGLLLHYESDGRVYPRSARANSVLDVLRLEAQKLGVHCFCGFTVEHICFSAGLWHISSGQETFKTRKIVLAAGGMAAPQLGGSNKGLFLAEEAGHTLNSCFPAVSPLAVEKPAVCSLKGLRTAAEISLFAAGKKLQKERGELQFTANGLSGICVFNLSRAVRACQLLREDAPPLRLEVDFLPEYDFDNTLDILKAQLTRRYSLPVGDLLTGVFPQTLSKFLLKESGINADAPSSSLKEEHIKKLASAIKALSFIPQAKCSWDKAQICAGGVRREEINPATMESRKAPGLYFAGEIVDIDAPCGGFNLQWAWSSGYVAGKSAADALTL